MIEEGRQERILKQAELQCSVGNCDWQPFNSIGACSVLQNITDELNVTTVTLEEIRGDDDKSAWEVRNMSSIQLHAGQDSEIVIKDNGTDLPFGLVSIVAEEDPTKGEEAFAPPAMARTNFISKTTL